AKKDLQHRLLARHAPCAPRNPPAPRANADAARCTPALAHLYRAPQQQLLQFGLRLGSKRA
ncbi:MAG TPA: hypothetical protein VNG33_03560, partial [Polyangiaceae bacterium]|nr:hypothetical protein [Polyangiaceae bacterium]